MERELGNGPDMNGYDYDYGLSGQYTLPWQIEFSTSKAGQSLEATDGDTD